MPSILSPKVVMVSTENSAGCAAGPWGGAEAGGKEACLAKVPMMRDTSLMFCQHPVISSCLWELIALGRLSSYSPSWVLYYCC